MGGGENAIVMEIVRGFCPDRGRDFWGRDGHAAHPAVGYRGTIPLGDRRRIDGLLCSGTVHSRHHCCQRGPFIGYKERGVIGGIVATLGVVFPSLVIISILAAGLANLADYPAVKDAFAGIRVCVCILIFNAVSKLARSAIVDWLTIGVFLVVLGINLFTDISPVVPVIFAGIVGLWGKLGLKK